MRYKISAIVEIKKIVSLQWMKKLFQLQIICPKYFILFSKIWFFAAGILKSF